MYIIDSGIEVPDIDYLVERVKELMFKGINVKDIKKLYVSTNRFKENAALILKEEYGIDNANSSQQILKYFNTRLNKEIANVLMDLNVDTSRYDIMNFVYDLKDAGYTEIDRSILDRYDLESLSSNVDGVIECINIILKNDILDAMYSGGKWTTNGVAMKKLALKDYQDAIDILTYRKLKKYTEVMKSLLESIASDGYIHPTVSVSRTNRINYSNPALMNIPKQLLWNVIGPREQGNMLVSIDIKQQEPWIVINSLGINSLKQILENNSDGLYEQIFYEIFKRYPEPIERSELKMSWNAMTYGASIKGVEDICRNIDGKAVYKYFSSFPEFKAYKARCNKMASKNVQLCRTYFGTELVANEFGSKLKRVLMDLPIQGTGADILALLVKHFDEYIEENELTDMIELYYTRHDEVILEVNKEFIELNGKEKVFDTLRDIFEHRIDDWEPFKVEITELIGNTNIESAMLNINEEDED